MINADLEFGVAQFIIHNGGPGSFTMKWCVPSHLSYFEGHFPDRPILPAVAIIDVTLAMIKKTENQKLILAEVKNSKFLKPVLPENTVEITINKITETRWKSKWMKDLELLVDLDLVLDCLVDR